MTNDYERLIRECMTTVSMKCQVTSDVLESILNALREAGKGYIVEKLSGTFDYSGGGLPCEVNEYLNAIEVEGQSKETLKRKRLLYSIFFSVIRKPVAQIETADVRRFMAAYKAERGISDRTMESYRTMLNALFRWLYVEEYIPRNIMEKIKPIRYEKKQRQALNRYELELFRSVCKDSFERALVDIMFTTGCRVSEICSMELKDIDWNANTIKIYNGKGKKDRTVIFSDRAKLSLKQYIDTQRKGDDPRVFVGRVEPHSAFNGESGIAKVLKLISARVNISKPISPHIMRHTFGTLAYQNGMSLEELQVLMGHESIDTTRIYAEVFQDQIRRSHEKSVV